MKQACAAAGQSLLMESYKRLFDARGRNRANSVDGRRFQQLGEIFQSAANYGETSWVRRAAIVNENERYPRRSWKAWRADAAGSAITTVGSAVRANGTDALVLLTNVDGLCAGEAVNASGA